MEVRVAQGRVQRMSFEEFLATQGYTQIRPIRPNAEGGPRYAALFKFLFTAAIIVGRWGDGQTYEDRWCYETMEAAEAALNNWDPETEAEPEGWHRHPLTGRRRDHGNPQIESIMF